MRQYDMTYGLHARRTHGARGIEVRFFDALHAAAMTLRMTKKTPWLKPNAIFEPAPMPEIKHEQRQDRHLRDRVDQQDERQGGALGESARADRQADQNANNDGENETRSPVHRMKSTALSEHRDRRGRAASPG